MSLYVENEKFEVGEAKRIGTLGKTEVTEEKWTPFFTDKKIDLSDKEKNEKKGFFSKIFGKK